MKTSISTMALSFLGSFVAMNTLASDAIGPGDSDSKWVVGGAVGTSNNAYAGEDNEGFIYPNIEYNGERFFVKDGTFNLALGQKGEISYGLLLTPSGSFLGDESEYRKNAKLAGLIERKYTVEGGYYVNHTTDLGRFHFTMATDLGNKYNGVTASASYTFDLRVGDWYVNPVVGMAWMGEDKANHLFGVSQVEATSLREAYEADSVLNVFAGVRGRYELSEHWDVNVSGGVVALGDGIKDSSIVDEDYLYHTSVGVNYNF